MFERDRLYFHEVLVSRAGIYAKGASLSRLLFLVVDGGALEEAPEEVGQVDDAAHQTHHAHCCSYLQRYI